MTPGEYECAICEGVLSDRRSRQSWAIVDACGKHVCDSCANDAGAVAELLGIELTLETVVDELGPELRDLVALAFARLGYLPFDDAVDVAAEVSDPLLLAQPAMTSRAVALVRRAFEAHGLKLADKPRWPSPGGVRHVELQPREGLDPTVVCRAQALLSPGFIAAQEAVGVAGALAGLLEIDRMFRRHLLESHGRPAETAAHIESRELATLHAAYHEEKETHAPARKTEN